jgi:hypothetical protein
MDKLVSVMAGYKMAFNELVLERWRNLLADICCIRATRMEPAAIGGIDGARHFAWQDDSCSPVFDIGHWNGGNQCLGVWM